MIYLANTEPDHFASAQQGVRIYLADTASSVNHKHADEGIKLYLADSNGGGKQHTRAQEGINEGDTVSAPRLRILLSYWYYRTTDLDKLFAKCFKPPYPEVFADSGAFSAWSQGGSIDRAAYIAWIHKYQHLFSVYANLDVIMDADATWRNQLALEREGLHPLPVFHVTEEWSNLDRYLERYPYIALGVGGHHAKVLMPWLVQCFKRADKRAVYHGFGMTNWDVLKSFPWYSVDSSSWGQGFRFGSVPIFDERRGRFFKLQLGDHKSCYASATVVRSLGFDPADFADRARNDRKKICAIAALSYIKAEQWLQKRWGPIVIPEHPGKSGARLYLAESKHELQDVRSVASYLEQQEEKSAHE